MGIIQQLDSDSLIPKNVGYDTWFGSNGGKGSNELHKMVNGSKSNVILTGVEISSELTLNLRLTLSHFP